MITRNNLQLIIMASGILRELFFVSSGCQKFESWPGGRRRLMFGLFSGEFLFKIYVSSHPNLKLCLLCSSPSSLLTFLARTLHGNDLLKSQSNANQLEDVKKANDLLRWNVHSNGFCDQQTEWECKQFNRSYNSSTFTQIPSSLIVQ